MLIFSLSFPNSTPQNGTVCMGYLERHPAQGSVHYSPIACSEGALRCTVTEDSKAMGTPKYLTAYELKKQNKQTKPPILML